MFKVNNKTTNLTTTPLSIVSIVHFEHVFICWFLLFLQISFFPFKRVSIQLLWKLLVLFNSIAAKTSTETKKHFNSFALFFLSSWKCYFWSLSSLIIKPFVETRLNVCPLFVQFSSYANSRQELTTWHVSAFSEW